MARPYDEVCAVRKNGAPRSSHPTGEIVPIVRFAGAVRSHQTNELRDTVMSRLRRVTRMCSSKKSGIA